MPVILFRGTVRPPIFRLNIDRLPTVRYGWPADNLTADFMVTVKESALEVRCEVSRFDKDAHLSMLTMHAYNIAQAAVDCFCFSTGIGLAVFIEIFIDPNGKRTTLVSKIDIVDGLCAAFNLDPSFTGPNNYESMFNIVMSDRQVLLALNDLTITIGHFDLV